MAYRVWYTSNRLMWFTSEPVLVFIRQRIRRTVQQSSKIIIYTNTIRQIIELAQKLQCEMYYSQQINKLLILQRFTQGQTQIITATSALGMGIDIPDIRYIIYIGMPRTLLDYAQKNRYTERDGQLSKTIIIQLHRPIERDKPVQKYIDVVPGVGYRRYILDRYLDGPVNGYERRYCRDKDPEEIRCDRCNPEWQSPSSSAHSAHSAYSAHSAHSAHSAYSEHSAHSEHSAYSAHSAHSAYSGHSEYAGYSSYTDHADRDSSSNESIVSQAPLIPIAERQRQRVQAQRQAAPDIQQRMQNADQ